MLFKSYVLQKKLIFFKLICFQKTDHLSKFNVTWELHNKHLFQSIAYTEPSIQSSLHLIISQLRWDLQLFSLFQTGFEHVVGHEHFFFSIVLLIYGGFWVTTIVRWYMSVSVLLFVLDLYIPKLSMIYGYTKIEYDLWLYDDISIL